MEMRRVDELQNGDTAVHRLSAAVKFLITVIYILVVMSFERYNLSGLLVMILYPVLVSSLSGITLSSCLSRFRFILPLLLFTGIFNPILDRDILMHLGRFPVSGGMVSFLTLMLKGIYCLLGSVLFVCTTRIETLCTFLQKIRVPSVLVSVLLLTYRYIFSMAEEVAVMTDAYHLRAPNQKGIHISAWGSFLGQLLLRSMDRARELYTAMVLRGFNGNLKAYDDHTPGIMDILWAVVWIVLFLVFRNINVTRLIGSMFVR